MDALAQAHSSCVRLIFPGSASPQLLRISLGPPSPAKRGCPSRHVGLVMVPELALRVPLPHSPSPVACFPARPSPIPPPLSLPPSDPRCLHLSSLMGPSRRSYRRNPKTPRCTFAACVAHHSMRPRGHSCCAMPMPVGEGGLIFLTPPLLSACSRLIRRHEWGVRLAALPDNRTHGLAQETVVNQGRPSSGLLSTNSRQA